MAESVHPAPPRKCPICGKPSREPNTPFCSARCQDIDLNRWLSDAYRIPTREEPEPVPQAGEEDED